MNPVEIRDCEPYDIPFIEKMLFEAFFWNPTAARPPIQAFLANEAFRTLLANWDRPGDTAMIAHQNGRDIGAAWYRFWTQDNHSYGFVDPKIPELGMGVEASCRSQGVGRRLLRSLMVKAGQKGVRSISLSVDPLNFALSLYESEGFRRVGQVETSWTMLAQL